MGHFAMSRILLHGFLGLILFPIYACDDGPADDGSDQRLADMASSDGGPTDGASDAMDGPISDAEPDETDGGAGRECGEGEPVPDCSDTVFVDCTPTEGTNGATIIRGTIVTPDRVICDGEILFSREDQRILCLGESCADNPLAADASVICSDLVLPGLIDPHNHMSFNTLPPWRHGQRLFNNRGEWRNEIGGDLYDARPPRGDPVAARYNELRLLMAGTTSVHKAEDTRSSHDHVRNLDRGDDAHGLGYGDWDFTECVFPLFDSCGAAPDYDEGDNIPRVRYVAHLSEGIDSASRDEFDEFVEQNQLGERTTLVHCVACAGRELSAVRAAGAHIVWSPQSNIDLYGQTTDVATALNMGIVVALGPDWSASGTMNQLSEMKCAQRVSKRHFDKGQ